MKQKVTKRLLVKRSTSVKLNHQCSVIATLKLFATKWKPCILCYQPMRYNELYRIITNISRKMLSEHLKELEINAIMARVQYDDSCNALNIAYQKRVNPYFLFWTNYKIGD